MHRSGHVTPQARPKRVYYFATVHFHSKTELSCDFLSPDPVWSANSYRYQLGRKLSVLLHASIERYTHRKTRYCVVL